jgi:molybdopterin-guanine dinucleotide biosynthesis protein A
MKILGAIIAGGKSARMGGAEKSLIDLAGRPVISHIVTCLQQQTDQVIINANGEVVRFQHLGLDVVVDPPEAGGTPLGGLAAVLSYAGGKGFDAVVSTPSDTPFLPDDLSSRLVGTQPAIASSGGQDHYLTGFWPVWLGDVLKDASARLGLRRMQDWVTLCEARTVEWDVTKVDPFFNINTPEDLEQAKLWLETKA